MKRKSSSSPCINDQPPMKPKTRIRKRRSPSSETPVRRTSIFRGVTRHRLSGRFEAHLWDKNNEGINNKKKKGRQVYLGAYDKEEAAARTYDLAAIKHWGPQTILNFEVSTYKTEMEEMQKMSNEEYIAFLRRKSSGFSRGVSMYRGVAKHHHNGRWEARLGCLTEAKYMYLGTFATQEEAAKAYDLAAIKHRGANAITNFDISHYSGIMDASPTAHDDPPPSEDGVASPTAHDDPPPSEGGVMELKPQEDEELLPEMQNLKFEQDNPWSLSMELGYAPFGDELGYAPFGDELDMFNDHGPEATIDSIFTKPVSNNNGCATSASSPLLASSSRVNLGV